MAAAEVASRPQQGTRPCFAQSHRKQPRMRGRRASWPLSIFGKDTDGLQTDRPSRRKPFTQWVKNLASLKNKGSDQQEKSGKKKNGNPLIGSKHKKSHTHNGTFKNNPYPESGHLQPRDRSPASSRNGQLSFSTPASRPQLDNGSYDSLTTSTMQEREAQSNGTRSGAPTLATNAETVHSDAGNSRAATTTTHGGALSSIDGAGADSTFSSPNQSQHSLTTTLTTIQSSSAGTTLQGASGQPNQHHHGSLNNPNPVMFSHQYPVSPAPSTSNTISAIPRHLADTTRPNTYSSATANGLLSDNASILTLASSSKRRRRSMDTDASVRALAPGSLWGGSRESLPPSVLSGNTDAGTGGFYSASQSRPSIGGLASAERASVYSNQGPAFTSERNSYYSHRPAKDPSDAKSLRSLTNMDARSLGGDARSMNADAKSLGEVTSLKGYDGSIRSGALGHGRNDSIPGSIGTPLASPNPKHASASGALSRRSSDWQELDRGDNDEKDGGDGEEDPVKDDPEEHDHGEVEDSKNGVNGEVADDTK